jgi:hypothetical protein
MVGVVAGIRSQEGRGLDVFDVTGFGRATQKSAVASMREFVPHRKGWRQSPR